MHYSGKTERYPLNDDIWSMILSLVGGDDARALSLASRCIHLVARRLVLSRAELSTPRQLMNACSFMLEDSRHRACWLRELRIRSSALGPRPSSGRLLIDPTLLADCLHAAQNLRTLVLPCVEALVVAEPHLEDALVSLARLDCIELSGIAERALDVTLKMASRPSQVTLGFVPPMPFPESLSALGSLPLLGNAHTVELRMQLYHSPTAEFKLSTLGRHSSVREVRLVSCTPLPLHHLFPNMRTLRMRGMKYTQSRGWGDWAWPSSVPLAEVTASIADITSLSKAPIRQLYIRETSEFWLHERVRDALIATRPIYLNIRPETWYHGSGGLEALGTFLQASLGQEGRLRCLEVTVTCYTPLEAPLVWVVRPTSSLTVMLVLIHDSVPALAAPCHWRF